MSRFSEKEDDLLWDFLGGQPPSYEFSQRIATDPEFALRLAKFAQLECDLRKLASPDKRKLVLFSGVISVCVGLLLVGAFLFLHERTPEHEAGTPLIVSAGGGLERIPQPAGEEVVARDRPVSLEFARESTRLNMREGSRFEISQTPAGGKKVALKKGFLSANVEKQQAPMLITTPHLEILVRGTSFDLDVGDNGSRTNVSRGLIEVDSESLSSPIPLTEAEGWWQLNSKRGVSMASARSIIEAPRIDANVDDVWESHPRFPLRFLTQPDWTDVDSAEDHSASWRAVWDDEALYVLIEVQDDKAGFGGKQPWMDDCAEIFVDPDLSRTEELDGVNDFLLFYAPERNDIVPGIGSMPVKTGMTSASSRSSSGYLVEAKITWESLGLDVPEDGKELGFSVATSDVDEENGSRRSQLTWTPKQAGDFKRPNRMGVLRLQSALE